MFFLLVESVQWPTRPSRAFRRKRRASRRCPIAPLTGSRRAKQPVRLPGSCFCYSSTHERRHDYHPPGKAEKAGERKGRAGACGLRPRPGGGNNSQASRGESAASRIPPRGFVAARAGVHGKIMCRKTGGRGGWPKGGRSAGRRGEGRKSEEKAGGRKETRDGGWSAERADGLRPVDGSGAACACGPADRADFRPCRTAVNEEGLPEPILPESAEVGLSTRARFFLSPHFDERGPGRRRKSGRRRPEFTSGVKRRRRARFASANRAGAEGQGAEEGAAYRFSGSSSVAFSSAAISSGVRLRRRNS